MQVPQISYETQTGGTLSEKSLIIEMNTFAFQSLINNLYADKIQSPLRELATNARDGHAKNGNLDSPFDVHLPTTWDPTFWVRDYGCSMTPEFMDEGYLCLFHSTKRNTNLETGNKGLGRMSPMAYTDAFTITTWYEGVERVYSTYMGDEGTPQVAKLHEASSDEPTGVMVSFPVKVEDIQNFRRSAEAAFFGFNPYPNILNETFVRPEPEVLFSGSNWAVYDEENWPFHNGIHVLQGSVIYPVDRQFFQQHMPEFNSSAAQSLKLVVEFPIGQLTPTESREALSYDEYTVANLKAGLSVVINELGQEVSKKFEDAETYWGACKLAEEYRRGPYNSSKRSLTELVASKLNWKGMTLERAWDLEMTQPETPGMFFEGGLDLRLGSLNHNVNFRQRTADTTLRINDMRNLQVVVQHSDCKQAPSRMRRLLSETDNSISTLWMRPASKADLQNWLKNHGNKEFIDLSTIEPLTIGKKSDSQIRFRTMRPTRQKGYYEKPLTETALYEVHKGMFFMVQSGANYSYMYGKNESPVPNDTVHHQMHRLVEIGILPENTKIMMLNKTNRKQLDKLFKFTDISYVIRKKMKERYGSHVIMSDRHDYQRRQNVKVANEIRSTGVALWGDLKAFCKDYPDQEVTSTLTSEEEDLISLWLPEQVQKVNDDVHSKRLTSLKEKYPLIGAIEGWKDIHLSRLTHYLKLEKKAAK